MSQAATKVRLEDLDIKPYMITKLKMAGIQSVFDLVISIPHQLVDIEDGMLTGTDEHIALELVTKAKKFQCCENNEPSDVISVVERCLIC
jgi:hypothetical protein